MSCSDCAPYGLRSCPMCEKEPLTTTCPECKGEGYMYLHITDNGNYCYVSPDIYADLPAHNREKETCWNCGGEGVLEITEVPEYIGDEIYMSDIF